MNTPDWISGLTHKDWMLDGYSIRGEILLSRWEDLDWSQAYVDMGPSPAGNAGPYWHVPLKSADTVHRLYPKLPTKWFPVVRHAIEESIARVNSDALQKENHDLRMENFDLRVQLRLQRDEA
jgi:hypothetical protein